MRIRTPEVVVVTGPTGVGKSAIAVALSQRINGEIISADSMQVYRGMDIGTGKTPVAERGGILHHLIDVRDLSEGFSVADFLRDARLAMEQALARAKTPVFCGGTAMYLKAAWHGLDESPPPDMAVRRSLEQMPIEELRGELRRMAPEFLSRVDPNNRRRLVRAIERLRQGPAKDEHGAPKWRDRQTSVLFGSHCSTVILTREPGELRKRIEQRVADMFGAGLVEETERLLKRGLAENLVALQALGYRQVVEHLQGRISLEQAHSLVQLRTWQFARRQMTWFRNQFEAPWVMLRPGDGPEASAEFLLQRLGGLGGQELSEVSLARTLGEHTPS